jgi:hypothetical protein
LLPDGCCCLSNSVNKLLFQNQHLTATYNDRWIGRDGPMAWPATSPDITPMDFFLWGHNKALIYKSPADSASVVLLDFQP